MEGFIAKNMRSFSGLLETKFRCECGECIRENKDWKWRTS